MNVKLRGFVCSDPCCKNKGRPCTVCGTDTIDFHACVVIDSSGTKVCGRVYVCDTCEIELIPAMACCTCSKQDLSDSRTVTLVSKYSITHHCCSNECLQKFVKEYKKNMIRNRRRLKHYCMNCDKLGVLKSCAGCRAARYCSDECQKIDWPNHKIACNRK